MPDMNKTMKSEIDMDPEAIAIDYDAMTAKPQDSPSGEYSSCTRQSDAVLTGDPIKTIVFGNYTIEYGYDQYGNPISRVTAKDPKNAADAEQIEEGINEALYDLTLDGYFNVPNNVMGAELADAYIDKRLNDLMGDMTSYMAKNWKKITDFFPELNNKPKSVFYHATRGAAIGTEMGSVKDIKIDWNSKDLEALSALMTEKELKITIGFFVSLNDKKYGTNMGLYSSTDINGNRTLGLVQVGNLILATIKGESGFDPNAVHHNDPDSSYPFETWDLGLIQNRRDKAGCKPEMFDPINSIGLGVGNIFNKLKKKSTWKSATQVAPSQEDWMNTIYHYRGGNEGRQEIWENMIKLSKQASWLKKWKNQ
jgi:hypothetical protein